MDGDYAPQSRWKLGRPVKQIPTALRQILDTTYQQKSDYVVYGDPEGEEVRELLRCGRLYAERRQLSFRHMICDQKPDGTAEIRFRLTKKRVYRKRDLTYWGVQ